MRHALLLFARLSRYGLALAAVLVLTIGVIAAWQSRPAVIGESAILTRFTVDRIEPHNGDIVFLTTDSRRFYVNNGTSDLIDPAMLNALIQQGTAVEMAVRNPVGGPAYSLRAGGQDLLRVEDIAAGQTKVLPAMLSTLIFCALLVLVCLVPDVLKFGRCLGAMTATAS